MRLISKEQADDGTTKYLWGVKRDDKEYGIESVFLDLPYRDLRYVVCASTQIGCEQSCSFCATSEPSFIDNLTADEINIQLIDTLKENLSSIKQGQGLGYALMGIGEPLLNYDNIIKVINSDNKIIPKTGFAISTVGIVPAIYRLAKEKFDYVVKLQISLHFSTNEKRSRFIPINNKYCIEDILKAASEFSLRQSKKVGLNYVLMKDVNDSDEDIMRLIKLINSDLFYVKLSELTNSDVHPLDERVLEIKNMLEAKGIETKIFRNFGKDIGVGCGQLALKEFD